MGYSGEINNNLFYNLPEHLQDKIIKMNPHPFVNIFENWYRNIRLKKLKKQRRNKLYKLVDENLRDYYTMTLSRLYDRYLDCLNDIWWEDDDNYDKIYLTKWCKWLEPRLKAIREKEIEDLKLEN